MRARFALLLLAALATSACGQGAPGVNSPADNPPANKAPANVPANKPVEPAKTPDAPKQPIKKPDTVTKPDPKTIDDVKVSGDEPGEAFEPRAAFTVTIEKLEKPTAGGAQFGYFFGGKAEAQDLKTLKVALLNFAKFRDAKAGHPGWDVKRKFSENAVAIRADSTAPWKMIEEACDAIGEAKIYRVALGERDKFSAADYVGKPGESRPVLTAVGDPYRQFKWSLPDLSEPDQPIVLVSCRARTPDSETEFFIGMGRSARFVLPEAPRPTLKDLTANATTRATLVSALAKEIEGYVETKDFKIIRVVLRAAETPGYPKDTPAIGFFFVALDAINNVNVGRKAAGKPELQGQLSSRGSSPPEPLRKPPEEEIVFPKDEK